MGPYSERRRQLYSSHGLDDRYQPCLMFNSLLSLISCVFEALPTKFCLSG